MDEVMIPVGHYALFLPTLNWSWGDYYLESLFGKIYLASGLFLLFHKILILLIRYYG
jgi:hypothetical protein